MEARSDIGERLISLVFLLAATLSLASCGGTTHPNPSPSPSSTSGAFGIALVNQGGMMTAPPMPSPLPSGFGDSEAVPCPHCIIVVEATSGQGAGRVVARVRTDAQGLFTVSLPPGRYLAYGRGYRDFGLGSRFTVRAGAFTRVRVIAGIVYSHARVD
jgi:hypothetical protein